MKLTSFSNVLFGRMIKEAAAACDLAQVQFDESIIPEITKHAVVWEEPALLTTIHVFARFGCVDALKTYLDAGYDPDMKEKILFYKANEDGSHIMTDFQDVTPLGYAIKYNQLAAATLLIGVGADVNYINIAYQSQTPLMYAAEYANVDVLNVLLSAGADYTAINIHGRTALNIAYDQNVAGSHDAFIAALEAYIANN